MTGSDVRLPRWSCVVAAPPIEVSWLRPLATEAMLSFEGANA